MAENLLNGKIVLVTGAARGIGKAIVKRLANHKMKIAISARDISALSELKDYIEKQGSKALICEGDLTNPVIPQKVIEKVVGEFGGLDILINNAGVATSGAFEDISIEEWDSVFNLNVRAPFLLCKHALPYLKASETPTIIQMSSVVGNVGYENQAVYSSSKHALMGLTKVLAQEVKKYGIRVHVVSPGGVATEMVSITRPDLDLSGLIVPEEIADAVEFLLTRRGNAVIDEIKLRREGNAPWR